MQVHYSVFVGIAVLVLFGVLGFMRRRDRIARAKEQDTELQKSRERARMERELRNSELLAETSAQQAAYFQRQLREREKRNTLRAEQQSALRNSAANPRKFGHEELRQQTNAAPTQHDYFTSLPSSTNYSTPEPAAPSYHGGGGGFDGGGASGDYSPSPSPSSCDSGGSDSGSSSCGSSD